MLHSARLIMTERQLLQVTREADRQDKNHLPVAVLSQGLMENKA